MDLPYAEITGIAICLIFSAFFSGSETALTSLSKVTVHKLIEKHPLWGRGMVRWQKNHTGILTSILIGNNLVNITASALATDWAASYFDSNGIPIAIGAMAFLLLFFGEITPKTFARAYAEGISPTLIYLVLIFHFIFYPLSWLMTRFIGLLFLAVGRKNLDEKAVTEEDIEYIVSLGRREGAIDKEKENLLVSIFDFSDTSAREIMVPRTDMIAIPVETSYDSVIQLTLESGFSRIPIFEESIDKVLGVFYTKNLLPPPKAAEKNDFLRKRMRSPVFIPESKKIREVMKMFQKEHIHMAIVVNEFGGTEGIVTLEDIIEELLGEIQDEFDTDEDRLHQNPDGSYLADARVDIEILEEDLALKFPHDREYESLGGFLMEVAGEVPAEGWRHHFQHFLFHVTRADANRLIQVRIESDLKNGDEEKREENSTEGNVLTTLPD